MYIPHLSKPPSTMSQPSFPSPPCFVVPALTPLVIAGIAASFEAAARRRERKRQPPGQLIALRNDGRRVHVVYHAPPALMQTPCVVLEAGSNSWSPMWDDVATRLGQFTRVLRYDRAGFGFSDGMDPGSHRTVGSVAEELAMMIRVIGAEPPYVLVGHSLGALFINSLVGRLRREDVCGVVYVDGASPETVKMLEAVVPKVSPPVWVARGLGRLGVLRLLAPVILKQYAGAFRGELLGEAMATWSKGEWLLAYTGEWRDVFRSLSGIRFEKGWLGSLPICVIVPDVYERTDGKQFIEGLQRGIARYSSDAKVIHVTDCGHFVQLERPDVVEGAIKSVIQRAGTGEWLLGALDE